MLCKANRISDKGAQQNQLLHISVSIDPDNVYKLWCKPDMAIGLGNITINCEYR